MASKGRDAVAGQLSADVIKELTGEDDLELIEDIEVIFNEVQYIGGLERCANLRSLTLIDTRLQCIDNLASVSMSLEKLMLTEQNIQRIEGLVLPNLRELYLQNNEISVLEGFENCPKLQRLWVFSNNIAKVRPTQRQPGRPVYRHALWLIGLGSVSIGLAGLGGRSDVNRSASCRLLLPLLALCLALLQPALTTSLPPPSRPRPLFFSSSLPTPPPHPVCPPTLPTPPPPPLSILSPTPDRELALPW